MPLVGAPTHIKTLGAARCDNARTFLPESSKLQLVIQLENRKCVTYSLCF